MAVLSTFTGIQPYLIAERSEATPGLFNNLVSIVSQNLDQLNSDTAAIAAAAPPAALNAASLPGSGVSQIQAAIDKAKALGIPVVYLPTNLLPYSAAQTSFYTAVQMVREGSPWDVFDVYAYGAKGDGTTDDSSAFSAAIAGAATPFIGTLGSGNVVSIPSGVTFAIANSLLYQSGIVFQASQSSGIGALKWTGAAGGIMFKPSNLSTANYLTFFRDLEIAGNNLLNVGIDIYHLSNSAVENCYIHDCTSGTSACGIRFYRDRDQGYACYYNRINGGRVSNNSIGILFTGQGAGSALNCANSNAIEFVNMDQNACSVWVERGNDFLILGSQSESVSSVHIRITGQGVHCIANRIENSANAGLPGIQLDSTAIDCLELATYWTNFTNDPVVDNSTAKNILRFSTYGSGVNGGAQGYAQSLIFGSNQIYAMLGSKLLDLNGGDRSGTTGHVRINRDTAADGKSALEVYNGTGTLVASITSVGQSQSTDGSATFPGIGFVSDASTGLYRAGAFSLALSGSTFFVPSGGRISCNAFRSTPGTNFLDLDGGDISSQGSGRIRINRNVGGEAASGGNAVEIYNGTSTRVASFSSVGHSRITFGSVGGPGYAFEGETSLGLYRSAASTMALSFGTFDLTNSGAVLSVASLRVKSGTNNSCGTAVLGSNGSVNVANTYVKTGDLIFLTDQTPGGTIGDIELGGIRDSSGFTIQSTSVTDTSTVAWLIVRPT